MVAGKTHFIRGATCPLSCFPITADVGRVGLKQWACIRQTLTDSTIWATMFMNGAPTGMTLATTPTLPNEIPKGLLALDGERLEVALGGITLRFHALRRDRVFPQSLNTPITVSELCDPRQRPSSGVPKTLPNRRLQVEQNQRSRSMDVGVPIRWTGTLVWSPMPLCCEGEEVLEHGRLFPAGVACQRTVLRQPVLDTLSCW